jgi:uncharacterized protein involved in exopolysaccharide biosynthesis
MPDGRNSGRSTSIELSRPMGINRPQPEATVNYAALISLIAATADRAALAACSIPSSHIRSISRGDSRVINPEFREPKEVDPTNNQATGDQYIETQTKLLNSPPVVQRTAVVMGPKVPGAIAGKQGIFATIRGWVGDPPAVTPAEGEAVVFNMLEDAKVKVDGTSDLITVTVLGPEPQLTADTANALIDQFTQQAQDARGYASGNTNKFLTTQLADARKKLQDAENALQEYARQTGIVIPSETQESVAADKLRQIQTDLAKAETDEADAKAQVDTSKNSPAEAMPQVLDDPTLRDNRARLADLAANFPT